MSVSTLTEQRGCAGTSSAISGARPRVTVDKHSMTVCTKAPKRKGPSITYTNDSVGIQLSMSITPKRTPPTHGAPRRVVGYIRVSTREQVITGYGLTAQREQLTEACRARNWELVAVYADEGMSGSKPYSTRPGLMTAVAAAESGEADSLVVWRCDRLGRLSLDGQRLLDQAKRQGWSLVDLEADADSSVRAGEFLWGLRFLIAQDERRAISDRTRDAMAVAKARGVRVGRPSLLPKKVVCRIVRERKAGATLASVGEGLERDGVPTAQGGVRWYPATIRKVLAGQVAARLVAKK